MVKSGRDPRGQVHAQAYRDSPAGPVALAQEKALDLAGCANCIRGNDLSSGA
jgi:hypothetical protein